MQDLEPGGSFNAACETRNDCFAQGIQSKLKYNRD